MPNFLTAMSGSSLFVTRPTLVNAIRPSYDAPTLDAISIYYYKRPTRPFQVARTFSVMRMTINVGQSTMFN